MRVAKKRSYGRDVAMTISGVALGIAGSRLVPPLAAFVSGSVRTRLGADVFDLLQSDHRYILTTLDKMEQASNRSAVARLPLLLAFKRALAKHALAEEDVVYPILSDQLGADQASRQLYAEHADMKIHLYHLEVSLQDPESWKARVRELQDLIGKHIRDEEEIEFPRLRTALTEEHRQSLSGKIRREEALVL